MNILPNKSRPFYAFYCWWAIVLLSSWAQATQYAPTLDYVVQASATVTASPPTVTLSWPAESRSTSYKVARRILHTSSWGTQVTVPGNPATLTSWTDTTVAVGVSYEYQIERATTIPSGLDPLYNTQLIKAYGYLCGGIAIPEVEYRGKVVLIVDNTMSTPLASELARLNDDLVGDGWTVIRHDVSRTDTVVNVKNLIKTDYLADPTNVKSVFLFGHVPVPYSGNFEFDGHTTHKGAWATDLFYADMDGTWTDSTVNTASNNPQPTFATSINTPGDGKYDQVSLPSKLELQVGRVDLSSLTGLTTLSLNETELLRQYLNKDHNHRFAKVQLPRRGIVEDIGFGASSGAFSQVGWRASSALYGAANTTAGTMRDLISNGGAQFYFLDGPGSVNGCGNYGSTNYSANPQFEFMLSFGSWFGDFDQPNNFLRAALSTTTGLTNSWCRTFDFLHPMALGETIGDAMLIIQNTNGADYTLTVLDYAADITPICTSLMGDPTLRLTAVTPPANLLITTPSGLPVLNWTASADATLGYSVYRASTAAGPFVRVASNVTATTWTDFSAGTNATYVYAVKATKLETTGGGTYVNSSQAITNQIALGTPAAPVLTALAPATGTILGGNKVTITGSNLTSSTSVKFGAIAVTPTVLNDAQVTCVAPAQTAGAVNVTVTTPGGTTAQATPFTYAAAVPTVTSISPNTSAWSGPIITLTGTNLADVLSVTFDGVPATIRLNTATQITCNLPTHAPGQVNVVVTTPGGSVTKINGFTYQAPDPGGFVVMPKMGPPGGGTPVTITGYHFVGPPSVTFGGVAATAITVISPTQITCITPPGTAGTAVVAILDGGGTTTRTASAFTYTTALPAVSSIVASSGPTSGGTQVTFNGTNLIQHGVSAVTFGGRLATELVPVSATQITCVTPPHAAGPVEVNYYNLDGMWIGSGAFTYTGGDTTPPVNSVISPGDPTTTGATITWTSDENSDSQVRYGLTTAYGLTTTLDTTLSTTHSVSLTGLTANTLYHYQILSRDAAGNLTTSADFTFTTASLPGPWTAVDIGTVGAAGTDSFNAGTGIYTIVGSGAGISGTADAFHYVYQTLTGDGQLQARVVSVQNTGATAKAGVMVRQNTTAGSTFAMIAASPGSVVNGVQRITTGSAVTTTPLSSASTPCWISVIKDGTLVSIFQSPDGVNWTYGGAVRLTSLTSPVDIGFAVSSGSAGTLSTAKFDNITLNKQATYKPALPWYDLDIGGPALAGVAHTENHDLSMFAGGTGLVGTADKFHFNYQAMVGNGVIVARVNAVSGMATAGVAMRQNLTPGSTEAALMLNAASGIGFVNRASTATAVATVSGAAFQAPYWVKVVREGNIFSGYQSADGITWVLVGTQTIYMTNTIYAGVAASSGNDSALSLTLLDHVRVLPPENYLTTGAISAGANHSAYLATNGSIWTWGLNANGQLGDGSLTSRTTPVRVPYVGSANAVSAGASHTLALKNNGTVWVWGLNSSGQLGDGTTSQRTTPFALTSLSGIMAVSAGTSHSLALKNDGTVWAWGNNSNGQLGDGTTTQRTAPVQITGLSNIVAISAGGSHSLALKLDGTVWAWGNNSQGQLGDGTTIQRLAPVQVGTLNSIQTISAGFNHSLAVGDDGSVLAWGDNASGELGDGTTVPRDAPTPLTTLSGITSVKAGNLFSMALKNDGSSWVWGSNASGQLGNNTVIQQNTPAAISGFVNVAALGAGTSHSVAILSNGTLWAWGNGTNGQLGNGAMNSSLVPVQINPAPPVISSALTASSAANSPFTYSITASNTPSSFSATGLPAGLTLNTVTGVISGTPTVTGSFSIGLTAGNLGGNGTATLALTLTVPPAPVINSATTATATKGVAFNYAVTASNGVASYAATGLPAGLGINTVTGMISGTPTALGTSTVNLSATNAGGTGTMTLTLTVNPLAPVISSAATATGKTGTAFSYQITAQNGPTSFAATGLPAGLSLNTTTGIISGTPGVVGVSTINLSATNAGGTGTKTLTLTVTPPTPAISSASTASGMLTTAFTYTIVATNSPTSYNATGLPAGLTVNTATGVISGTPTATGVSNVTLSATNAGGTGIKALTITITAPVPVISSAAAATGKITVAFSYTIAASNSPTSYNATGLPAGLSVNTTTGVISGTPAVTGVFTVTLSAINTYGTGTKTLTLTVNPLAPVVGSAATATGTTGVAFSYSITATNSPTGYNATGLPAGLTVNTNTGVISGTPTVTGVSTITLSAANAGGTGTKTLTLTVN